MLPGGLLSPRLCGLVVAKATFYFVAEAEQEPIVFETEGAVKKIVDKAKGTVRGLHPRRVFAVAKFLYQNRKAELALATGCVALAREIVQASTGH